MTTDDADQLISQVVGRARYETLREVVNQLAGVLVAHQRSAPSDQQARWRDEHRAIRARARAVEPGTPEVEEALDQLSARLRELQAARER